MSDINQYLGQIEFFAFPFAPNGWALCNGQLLSINQHQDLFSILGTTYGGDGRTTFALPDLQARTPIGQGAGGQLTPRVLGEKTGEETHTLTADETAIHSHWLSAEPPAGTTSMPGSGVVISKARLTDEAQRFTDLPIYLELKGAVPSVKMHPDSIQPVGGNAHANIMPYVTLNACISLTGPIPPKS